MFPARERDKSMASASTSQSKNTKQCPQCKMEVPKGAKKCPHCQSDLRSWFARHYLLTTLGVIFLIILVESAIGGGSNVSDTSNSPGSEKVEQPQEEAVKVSAEKLSSDYEANGVAADQKYKDKLVEITGTIDNIGTDILETPYITFETGNLVKSVQCMFKREDSPRLAQLSEGIQITVQGRVSSDLLNILVRDCNF